MTLDKQDPTASVATRQASAALRDARAHVRSSIFAAIGDLGGVPSQKERQAGSLRSERLIAWVDRALQRSLAELDPQFVPFAGLTDTDRSLWEQRAPLAAAAGVDTYRQLMRFSSGECDGRYALAAGLFRLTADYLDWLGRQAGTGVELACALPAGTLQRIARRHGDRHIAIAAATAHASAPVAAFAALLAALLELIDRLPGENLGLRYIVAQALSVRIIACHPLDASLDHDALARANAAAPTLVIGELARLSAGTAHADTVWNAALTLGPVLGFLDDVKEAPCDGAAMRLESSRTGPIAGGAGVAASLDAWLASDRCSAEVVRALRRIDTMLEGLPQGQDRRTATLAWLRILLWERLA